MAQTAENSVRNCTHELLERFGAVRQFTRRLCENLSSEDCVVQSMPDASPVRWHLAHTTWFFETFVLKNLSDYEIFHADFEYLFNSYYNSIGKQFPRHMRGLITRPSLQEVGDYRDFVDAQMSSLIEGCDFDSHEAEQLRSVIELGLQHEQQHQELILTDIKHVLSCNPLLPKYHSAHPEQSEHLAPSAPTLHWHTFDEGVYEFGHQGDDFAFDNETPRHRAFIHDFQLADRLVTCGDYLDFIDDGGYESPNLWLSLGWASVTENNWTSPLYWHQRDGQWYEFTLSGERRLNLTSPVCHVSYYEADAFARWSNKRLPTEFEWELAARGCETTGNFSDSDCDGSGSLHPCTVTETARQSPRQMFGDVWEWTSSQYLPYPGFKSAAGALGEYNGKFMCNQFVLRGGSCATPQSHIRKTYRNFFPPGSRWQFAGIRLAQ